MGNYSADNELLRRNFWVNIYLGTLDDTDVSDYVLKADKALSDFDKRFSNNLQLINADKKH